MKHSPLSEFIDRISQIMPIIVREFIRRQTENFSHQELTFSQFLVLSLLNSQGKMKMKDLADNLKVTTANMTGIVERLIRQRMVERISDPKDRRVIYVEITGKGKTVIEKVEENRRRVLMEIFGSLSESERQQYIKILTKIRDTILKKR